jgi:O-antigen/teichoic acid export membrane protein
MTTPVSSNTIKSFKKNMVANYVGAIGGTILAFVFTPEYVRLLGLEAYGLVGFFYSMIAIASLLDLGLSSALNRELARRTALNSDPNEINDMVKSVELVYFSIGLILGVFFVGFSPIFAQFWFKSEILTKEIISISLIIMSITLSFRWCSTLYIAGLSGLEKQVQISILNLFASFGQTWGAIIVLTFFNRNLIIFFIYQGIIVSIQTIFLRICLKKSLPKATRS